MDNYLLIMVLDDSNRLNEVMEAWRSAGINGITIFESTGMNRVLPRRDVQPMFVGFGQMFGGGRIGHHTLIAIIDSIDQAETAVEATEAVIGKLADPHTGVVCLTPLIKVWGVPEEN
ncbi:MAG: hypothetical protein WAM60_26985 [Candidatus Promineifilaceae bacterium]